MTEERVGCQNLDPLSAIKLAELPENIDYLVYSFVGRLSMVACLSSHMKRKHKVTAQLRTRLETPIGDEKALGVVILDVCVNIVAKPCLP